MVIYYSTKTNGNEVSDYDENQNIDTHQYFRHSDNFVEYWDGSDSGKTLGVILSNEPTRIEISFDILDDGVWDISKRMA
jgi:hypothetical protein